MPIGPNGLAAFKAKGSPPMPMPPAPAKAAKAKAAPPAPPADDDAPADGADASDDDGADSSAIAKAVDQVQNGGADPDVEQMMAEYDSASGPPPQAVDLELWQHCTELIDPDGEDALDDYPDVDPWMIVGQLYANLGGEIADDGAGGDGDADDAALQATDDSPA